jgi:phage FluMu protein Com
MSNKAEMTITCDKCHKPMLEHNAKFLRPVIMLCGDCRQHNKWYPASTSTQALDKSRKKADTS